ncbi:MAG: Ig domain-containing protein, partial [Bryobacteraceae bacterium]
GTFQFTVQVGDELRTTVSHNYRLVIAGNLPTIAPESLPPGTTGSPYAQTLTATGGTAPYTWSVSAGSLPGGLTLGAANGEIRGTPATQGAFTFTVQVADRIGQNATKNYTLTIVSSLTIQTESLPALVIGVRSSVTLAAAGGTAPYTWSVLSGSLPPGFALEAQTGVINGTPTTGGSYEFTIQVADAAERTASKLFRGSVSQSLAISTESLPDGQLGEAYNQTLNVTGGAPPYNWSVASGSLPPAFSLDAATGVIQGTASTPGAFRLTAAVRDSNNVSAERAFTLTVRTRPISSVEIEGLPANPSAAQQPEFSLALGSAYPAEISGTITLTFAPDAVLNSDDPSIQFSTGGRTASFTIRTGETRAVFSVPQIAIQTGTVAGTITLTTVMQSGGETVTCSCSLTRTIRIERSAPVITALRLNRTTGGFEAVITGYATSREVTQATFRLAGGAGLQTPEIVVPVTSVFNGWYEGEASRAFGSQFLFTMPFNVQGQAQAISSVSVVLTNSIGASAAANATF